MGPIEITVIVLVALAGLVAIFSIVRNKKNGKTSCGCDCGCSSCPHCSACEEDKKKLEEVKRKLEETKSQDNQD